jgi:general secretion pathway protein H
MARTGSQAVRVKIRTSPAGSEGHRRIFRAGGQAEAPRGFTLLELLIVLALISLVLGLVVPSLYRNVKRERDRASVRQLSAVLRLARSTAVTQRQRVRVFVDVNAGRYLLEKPRKVGDLSGVSVTEPHLVWPGQDRRRGYIAFYGDGSSSGGRLALVGPAGQRHVIEVEIITGRVTVKTGV